MIGNDINLKGKPAFKGERGYSAFEIAKQNVRVGTKDNIGMTTVDVQRILATYNVDFTYMLDDGGSWLDATGKVV